MFEIIRLRRGLRGALGLARDHDTRLTDGSFDIGRDRDAGCRGFGDDPLRRRTPQRGFKPMRHFGQALIGGGAGLGC